MRQVLFPIPIPGWGEIPIYGFGTMLVVALFLGIWIASRRAKQNDVNPEHVQDAAFWIVIAGIIGARVVFMIQFRDQIVGNPLWAFFMFWKGGLVFYGALIGGVLGYILAYKFVLRKHQLSAWKVADIIVPSVALGLCLGRVGCLLNGCCYGGEAPQGYPLALHFPTSGYAGKAYLDEESKEPTKAAGFTLDAKAEDRRTVAWVDPGTAAAKVAGLRAGDVVVKIDGLTIPADLGVSGLRQGLTLTEITFQVERNGAVVDLPAIKVETLNLPADWPHGLAGLGIHFDRGADPENAQVVEVVAGKLAAQAGVEKGDIIKGRTWALLPKDELTLTVRRDGQEVTLPSFWADTVGLHPTQVYESISTLLLFLVLTAYFPLRRRDGEVLTLFLIGYPIHRFLNEMLRNDTQPVAFGMTLSQNISLVVFVAALVLGIYLVRRPVQYPALEDKSAATPSGGGPTPAVSRQLNGGATQPNPASQHKTKKNA